MYKAIRFGTMGKKEGNYRATRTDQRSNLLKIVGLHRLISKLVLEKYGGMTRKGLEMLICADMIERKTGQYFTKSTLLHYSSCYEYREIAYWCRDMGKLGYVSLVEGHKRAFGGGEWWNLTGKGQYCLQYYSRLMLQHLKNRVPHIKSSWKG
ncbi:hypothetical protein LCGC14_0937930 [marine sediment metagenome]|uniref:Uncharacterized protein n=1 Tax=marine sediment metagenome TaxID=412755 RepID=A0A0F9P730_9ZZZZ